MLTRAIILDNAHPRAKEYAASLRDYYPWNKWVGRYCNGPVGVEYIVSNVPNPKLRAVSGGANLIDYACEHYCLIPSRGRLYSFSHLNVM